MSPTVIAAVVVVVCGGAWILLMAYSTVAARRRVALEAGRELQPGEAARDLPWPAARLLGREDVMGVTRRQFLNRMTVGGIVVGLAQFGMASLDFLWPRLRGGFGATIDVVRRRRPAGGAAGHPGAQVHRRRAVLADAARGQPGGGRQGPRLQGCQHPGHRHLCPVPQVPPPGVQRAVVHAVEVVRVPVPRIEVLLQRRVP
jgi:hypothetical protein